MQVKEVKNEGLKRSYDIVIPAKDFDEKFNQRLSQVAKGLKAPGFRPGKVPLNIVEKQHGQRVLGEVLEAAVSESYRKLLVDNKLRPAFDPKFDVDSKFDKGKDLKYSVELELYPDVPDVDFTKLSIEQHKVEVEEDEIKDGLKKLTEANKEFAPITTDRAAKKGDVVIINFVGKVGKDAFEGGTADDVRLELGSNQFIPGFEDQLIGAKKGSKTKVKVTFPENYGKADLAGKDAVFDVETTEIEAGKEPKIDENFAKKLGYESVDKLKEAVKERIEGDYEQACRMVAKKDLFDVLEGKYTFDVPESMLDVEIKTLENAAAAEAGEGKEGDEKKAKKPTKKEQEKYQKLALRRVRLGIVLSELARKENVDVSENELRTALFRQASQFPGQEQYVIEMYQKNPQLLDQIRGPILENKVVDLLFERMTLKEKKVSPKEFKKIQDAIDVEG